jgi:tRNA threonylcarbamoyladenosine biosynthesis protein TsaB
MQIAIDTSTDIAGIALVREDELLAELTWRCGQNHTVELYPRLDFLLSKSGQEISTADCIFVARGPGSFNGLRVGVAAAKGLALSLGIPIIAISTLESMAFQQAASGLPVCSLQNAGREEIAAAIFQKKVRKGWTRLSVEHLTTPEALVEEIKGEIIICGEINAATREKLKKLFKSRAIFPPWSTQVRRPSCVAELARQRLLKGDYDNLAALQPIYLRRPPVTERKKA